MTQETYIMQRIAKLHELTKNYPEVINTYKELPELWEKKYKKKSSNLQVKLDNIAHMRNMKLSQAQRLIDLMQIKMKPEQSTLIVDPCLQYLEHLDDLFAEKLVYVQKHQSIIPGIKFMDGYVTKSLPVILKESDRLKITLVYNMFFFKYILAIERENFKFIQTLIELDRQQTPNTQAGSTPKSEPSPKQ